MYTFNEISNIISAQFEDISIQKQPKGLYDPINYILSSGGKRLRPALVLMGCNVFNTEINSAIPAARAIEIFHNFTLLHDDIMDNAEMRRGNETVHVKWNNNTAILSGDAMSILAYVEIAKTSPEYLKPVLEIFNTTAIEVCEGQQYDMDFEQRMDVSVDEYLEMIRLKTSVLIAAALKIGAIAGGASKEDADLLYGFGENIGLAFQLQDDFLDAFGDPIIFGKKIGGDIIANKKTFLLLNAMTKSLGEDKENLIELISKPISDENAKIEAVLNIFKKYEIDKLAKDKMNTYYQESLVQLEKISVAEEKKTELKNFAASLLNRIK